MFHGIEVPRGSLITSIRNFSKLTGMSPNTVRACLDKLVETGEIEKTPAAKWTMIKVVKYDKYQQLTAHNLIQSDADCAQFDTVDAQETDGTAHILTHNRAHFDTVEPSDRAYFEHNRIKKQQLEQINNIYAQITQFAQTDSEHQFAQYFFQFWMAYPRKVNKVRAEKAWNETITDLHTMSAASEGAAALLRLAQFQDKRFIPYPETFIRERRWENQDIQDEVQRMNEEAKQAAEHDPQQ